MIMLMFLLNNILATLRRRILWLTVSYAVVKSTYNAPAIFLLGAGHNMVFCVENLFGQATGFHYWRQFDKYQQFK